MSTNFLRHSDRCQGGGSGGPLRGCCARRRRSPGAKSRRIFFFLGVVVALCCLLFCVPDASCVPVRAASSTASGSGTEPVYLLNMMHHADPQLNSSAKIIWTGMDAAFYASGYTVGGKRPLVIVEPDSSANLSDVAAVIAQGLADHPTLLGVLGPYSDASTMAALNSDVVKENHLVLLAPFTGSSTVRVWNPHAFFIRAEPLAELKVIMAYVVYTLRAKRIAFMYLTDADYGDAEYHEVQGMLSYLERDPAVVYSVEYSAADSAVNRAAFDAMADTHPQVVIVWGIPSLQTSEFVRELMLDPRTSSAAIMGCFALQKTLYEAYTNVTAREGSNKHDHQIFSSAIARSPTDDNTNITHMALFQKEIAHYLVHSGRSSNSLLNGSRSSDALNSSADLLSAAKALFTDDAAPGQVTVSGWLAGKVIQRTLERVDWITDRATYQTGLFDQNRFVVGGDAVFGDYGGTCDAFAAKTGAMCNCNQGGHTAVLSRLTSGALWTVLDTVFTYSQAVCYSTDANLPKPLSVLTFALTDHGKVVDPTGRISSIVPLTMDFLNTTELSLSMAVLNASTTTQQAVLDAEVSEHTVDVLMGPMAGGLEMGDLLVVEPIFAHGRRVIEKRSFIRVMPTVAQEIYILYSNLPTIAAVTGVAAELHVVVRGFVDLESAQMADVLSRTADTFGYSDPTITSVAMDDDLTSAFSTSGVNCFLGFTDGDPSTIATFLATNPSAIIVADFKEFSRWHYMLLPPFSNLEPSVRRRFLTFANMPLWSDTSDDAHAASPLLAAFHEMLPDPANHTPAHLENMISAGFVKQLTVATNVINSANLVDTLYRKGTMTFYEMDFGKFEWSCSTTTAGETCMHNNNGARSIVVLSMERVLDPKVPVTVEATTPSMIYTTTRHGDNKLSPASLAGVIVGSVMGGLLLIGLVLAFVFCCLVGVRNNDAAPKMVDEPVTIVFTDIESSTALWAALPQLMPEAVAAHHRVIRLAISKHKCYEVKTIGDSFMIACKDAHSAVKLAMDIQTKLLEYDWKTSEIDDAYRDFELQRAQEAGGEHPHSAQLSRDAYEVLWNGLRVRMGIHTGLSDIRLDEVTRGYDYYGETSNMAARTEAITNGGQVVVTEATWWALSDATREQLDSTDLGAQRLRGVPHVVKMYQLNPVVGRQHANLRTEIEAVLPDNATTTTETNTLDDPTSSHTNMSCTAAAVSFVLASCFSTYPPAQRIRELQPLLAKWSVPAPPRHSGISAEDYCQGLLNRLAVRVGRVTEARLRRNGGDNGAESNLLSSVGGTAGGPRISLPLRSGSNAHEPEHCEDAPSRLRDRATMGDFHGFFRPTETQRSSLRPPSERRCRGGNPLQTQDEPMVFDLSWSRNGAADDRAEIPEPVVTNAAGAGRLT
ncbi:receptor-type adenylate cyclase a (RAC-A) [Leptomonas pyrrhocoris]|uniref:adenylate cyclase n=1 Tax=Leptomonas pyrrhocoris TaxID=157538 RepID=A0A0M9FS09_LEPPY|nr:receptor-type adenylate cyclase a (RAC-A) [Leptomonas pyrrhocoris]XP_015653315.1 receptor-type adenylate cyclase a (RAC-A) [Leptomonas pyrrhocoris]XP_015653316.1 receptor-type adenylate cyclase a (RAC-A) [Leptomonas pyrrhocoris]KPA74875.1 receptor-type adenylate cyclase a (RAC-A) [Leptomonas pyrrhocoris]KPA74876.1 receptor-type adenylate cyclase a (RAC-A) [Leptomonas pyrrhocoris]KPA74877.1 receptor-type adenylate cyclase a (RAC-A) [Leptomonas pyrrhocoris]|eukprot:XP_015653314.1 receptor-type adenylate cyclase a (RAC-A) [Leptomonas pyrrhocoris]